MSEHNAMLFTAMQMFWLADKEVKISANDARLFHYLLYLCGELGWKNPFRRSNDDLEGRLRIKTDALTASRERLQERGLITFTRAEKHGRGYDCTTEYTINSLPMSKGKTKFEVPKSVPQSVPQLRPQIRPQVVPQTQPQSVPQPIPPRAEEVYSSLISSTKEKEDEERAPKREKSSLFIATLATIHADYPDTDRALRRSPDVEKTLEKILAGKNAEEQTAILEAVALGVGRYAAWWNKLSPEDKKFKPPRPAAEWLYHHGYETEYADDGRGWIPKIPDDHPQRAMIYYYATNENDAHWRFQDEHYNPEWEQFMPPSIRKVS